MLKKRIIPCLDIKEGRTVKGINFIDIQDAGDPLILANRYVQEGADELVFLDITATQEKRKTLVALVAQIAKEINIPFTVGGGINSLEDAKRIIAAGADKISVNSAAIKSPSLISDLALELGSQCVVVAMDIKMEQGEWMVYINGGKVATGIKALDWAKQAAFLGAGELLVTAMDNDGTQKGFALTILEAISKAVVIPIIASGGAGTQEHFKDLFIHTQVSAALAASVFHFSTIAIPELKNYLKIQHIPIR
ncbi:MAG: imidazole glycerol phosphate synthase subunit HisF [Chitinophagia bacterium]|nr:imidazole glycerol phosphate synthase subunit HisF [Chitinophagia bacterium]